MSQLSFQAEPYSIDDWLIIHVPNEVSKQLPSRGLVMADVTINDQSFVAPLEPDGSWSHWFNMNKNLRNAANVEPKERVTVTLAPTKDWPKPQTPEDLNGALQKAPKAKTIWDSITPKAQWEWVRWIRATKQAETRARRVDVAISKMNSGMRRPCCFNSNMCTETAVSKNGVLLEPVHA